MPAWAAAVPAASAGISPVPGDGPYGPVPAAPAGAVPVIAAGGMPGWQITLIAVAAALAAATAAVVLDRAPGPAAGPPPPDDTRQPGPDTSQAWTTATVQARPGPCGRRPARLTHMPSRCQNTQICGPQKTSAKARSATQNGGSRAGQNCSLC